jgi:hypothetical protein
MARLSNPISRLVPANNHVERPIRKFGFFEKVRYNGRRRKTLIWFAAPTLDHVWSDVEPATARRDGWSKPVKHHEPQPRTRQPPLPVV